MLPAQIVIRVRRRKFGAAQASAAWHRRGHGDRAAVGRALPRRSDLGRAAARPYLHHAADEDDVTGPAAGVFLWPWKNEAILSAGAVLCRIRPVMNHNA